MGCARLELTERPGLSTKDECSSISELCCPASNEFREVGRKERVGCLRHDWVDFLERPAGIAPGVTAFRLLLQVRDSSYPHAAKRVPRRLVILLRRNDFSSLNPEIQTSFSGAKLARTCRERRVQPFGLPPLLQ